MAKKKPQKNNSIASQSNNNGQFSISIGKDTLNALLVPISILLAGLFVTVALLYSTNRIMDQAVTKQNLASAVSEALKTANLNTGTGTTPELTPEPTIFAKTTIDDDPSLGSKDAKVAIVEFSDYECPFCKRHYDETYQQIKQNYIDNGKALFVFRDYIAVKSHNPQALYAANAMECAKSLAGNEKYYQLHDWYFKNTLANGQGVTGGNDKFIDYAASVGIDKAKFTECITSNKFAAEIQKDEDDAAAAQLSGTPGFVIGKLDANGNVDGEIVAGAYPYATFQETLDKYLNS